MSFARFYIFVLVCALTVSCARKTKNSDGGQHGGGGEVLNSSAEDVKEAINKSIVLLTYADPRRNLLKRFLLQSPTSIGLNPKSVFPELDVTEKKIESGITRYYWNYKKMNPKFSSYHLYSKKENWFHGTVLESLQRQKPILKESGECPAATKAHPDASVSEYSPNAELCFNVTRLRRISKASLIPEISALIVHELVHMGGVQDETEATAWQAPVKNFVEEHTAFSRPEQLSQAIEMRGFLTLSKIYKASKVKDTAKSYLLLESARLTLLETPFFMDPLVLELSLRPRDPNRVNNFTNSVLALIEKLNSILEKGPNGLSADKGEKIYQELFLLDDQLSNNYRLYALGVSKDPGRCVLPSKRFDPFPDLERIDSPESIPAAQNTLPPPPLECDLEH